MRGNPGRNTGPERALRSAVHALGLRYRVGIRPEPDIRRTADLVFTRPKVAVFLDGCYWHACPQHHRPATGRTANFWADKIAGNQRRDEDTNRRLRAAGWEVVRVWEHEDPHEAAKTVANRVAERRSMQSPTTRES
jgi:DNA mismatch endonuclease (patch repair protein)